MDPSAGAESILETIYGGAKTSLEAATSVSAADAKRVAQVGGGQNAITYGEMCPSSWSSTMAQAGLGPDDVFYDLGSGRGTLVIHAALEARCRRCVGVELSRERHAIAKTVASRLSQLQVVVWWKQHRHQPRP